MKPPIRKNTKAVTIYMIPICFASVVRRRRASAEPLVGCRTGHGRVTIGFGATVLKDGLRVDSFCWRYPEGRIIPRSGNTIRGCPWRSQFGNTTTFPAGR
jgi:hypothetical protein